MTQWLFGTKQCFCFAIAEEQSTLERQFCWTCGKPVATNNGATFTQWIFRADKCQCANPNLTGPKRPTVHSADQLVLYDDRFETPDEAVIETFADRFDIYALLGKGGGGSVYSARDKLLNKRVAIKRLSKQNLNPQQVARLQQEARAASRLQHPNIVSVLDFGVSVDEPYLVMELAKGKTICDLLLSNGPLPIDTAIEITLQICEGLAHAHQKGVIHCDLSSRNIIVEEINDFTAVKILDFGVAKFYAAGELISAQKLTQPGVFTGNPLYASPEQSRGEVVDLRTDVYSLGCLLFEMLTGVPPFEGGGATETIIMHLNEQRPTLAERANGRVFPEQLEALVARALSRSANERFSSMQEFAAALQIDDSLLTQPEEKAEKQATSEMQPLPTERRTNRGILTIYIAVGALLAGALLVVSLTTSYRGTDHPKSKTNHPMLSSVPIAETPEDLPFRDGLMTDYRSISTSSFSDLADKVPLTDAKIEGLLRKKDLWNLDLVNHSGVTPERLRRLSALPIVSIDLMQSDVNEKGIEVLSRYPKLKRLSLIRCILNDNAFKALAKNASSLEELHAGDTMLNDRKLGYMSNMKRLKTLSVPNNPGITDAGWVALSRLKTLRNLNVGEDRLTDRGLSEIARNKNLESLKLNFNQSVTDSSITTLSGLSKLKLLIIDNTSIGSNNAKEFVRQMKKMKELRTLTIHENQLPAKDRRELLRALPYCKITLTSDSMEDHYRGQDPRENGSEFSLE